MKTTRERRDALRGRLSPISTIGSTSDWIVRELLDDLDEALALLETARKTIQRVHECIESADMMDAPVCKPCLRLTEYTLAALGEQKR